MLPVIETDEGLEQLEREIAALFDGAAISPPRPRYPGRGPGVDVVSRREYWHRYYEWRKLTDANYMERRRINCKRWRFKQNGKH